MTCRPANDSQFSLPNMPGNRSVRLPVAADGANVKGICTELPPTDIIVHGERREKRLYFRPARAGTGTDIGINQYIHSSHEMLYRRLAHCRKKAITYLCQTY